MGGVARAQAQLLRVQHGDIGPGLEVVIEQAVVIHAVNHISREHQAILRAPTVDVIAFREQRISETMVQIGGKTLVVRREERNAPSLVVQIPRFTRADMLDKRLEVALHDHADIADAALRNI